MEISKLCQRGSGNGIIRFYMSEITQKDYWNLWRDTIVTQFQSLQAVTGFSITALAILGSLQKPLSSLEKGFFKFVVIILAIQICLLLWEAHNDRKAAWLYFSEGQSSPSRVFYSLMNNNLYIWTRLCVVLSWVGILALLWFKIG